MRVLLVDNSLYAPVTPLFGHALTSLEASGECVGRFFDEAPLYRRRKPDLAFRAYTRLRRQHLGVRGFRQKLFSVCSEFEPDVIVAVKAAWLDRASVEALRRGGRTVLVNVLTDSPFNNLVAARGWSHALLAYDICASTKSLLNPELEAFGCRQVTYLPFAYEPANHFPEAPLSDAERQQFSCDVAFMGMQDPDRQVYLERLAAALPQLSFNLYGGGWERTPLARFARGMAFGRDYRLAVAGARVVLTFPRWLNQDTISMRTFEVPAMGGFLLAARTASQTEMLQDGVDAAYFDDPDDLVEKVRYYVDHEDERAAIARAGHSRITTGANTYADRLRSLLQLVPELSR